MNETKGAFAKYSTSGTFTYEFSELNKVKHHFCATSNFKLQDCNFRLKLYPNGFNDYNKDFIDIELEHCGGSRVNLEISFQVEDKPSAQMTRIMWYSSYQCFRHYTRESFPNLDHLAVSCSLKFIGNIPPLYKNLYLSSDLSDFTLKVNDLIIPVHKIVLAVHSSVFKTMFQKGMSNICCIITDTEPNIFKIFLRCLYTHECDVTQLTLQNCIDMWKIAHKYDVKEIESICCAHIKENLKVDNCLDLFIGTTTYNYPTVENILIGFIAKHLKEIFANQNNKFLLLKADKLALISKYM